MVAGEELLEHAHQFRCDPVGGHADRADGTHGQQRQRQCILPAVDLEALRCGGDQAGRLGHVARGILDGHDRLDLVGEAEQGGGLDLAARTGRDVVEDHREVRGLGHSREVVDQARLGGPVVVRRDGQDGVGTDLGATLRVPDSRSGVVAPRTGDDGYVDRLDHGGHDLDLFVVRERRRLAGRSNDHQGVVALLDEPARQRGRTVEVERPVLGERRDHGGQHPPEPWFRRHACSPSFARSMPSVASRSSCSSNHTVWYESIIGLVNHSTSPAWTRPSASLKRRP